MEPVEKTQVIRLMDIAVFGPMIVYGALNKKPPKIVTTAMVLIGLGTIFYNGYNYIQQSKRLENEI